MTMQWDRRQWCGASLGLVAGAVAPGFASAQADRPSDKQGDKQDKRPGRGGDRPGEGPFGTAERPFSAQSPWNCRPVDPVLDGWTIPKDAYFPAIESGKYSVGVFLCSPDDKPQRVLGPLNQKGVWDPDAEAMVPEVLIPRWPAGVLPASGSDGHADLVDPQAGIIHSFFQLKKVGDEWRAQQYAWTRLDGRGWGDPAHYFQGARAAAVPTMGGLIRSHEIEDGDSVYRHALALSLTFSGLSPAPGYIFPATSADRGVEQNKGQIPEGALLMLPPDFEIRSLGDLSMRKIGETLKRYGGYVVDRNHGTPFCIYAEIGARFPIVLKNGWNSQVGNDLERLRGALRQVKSVKGWLDGHDRPVDLDAPQNLLSMRGDWRVVKGHARAHFDTWRQAVVFEEARDAVLAVEGNRQLSGVYWARPKAGQACKLTARCSGDARLRVELKDKGGRTVADSGELDNGKSASFDWPDGVVAARTSVRASGNGTASADLRVVAAA
ncbi:Atrophin-1 multi-domain protein [Roseateles sp. SL47]|uniref:Atrophin-1 multi-domain protein n=1 Tax=Roseateles sp. SL47 TaxID=2995138 RepID=UPI002271B9AC|nr:Atrophin-1 multi-domain protein [Roseateles sp. SL47]WAC75147.1 Atrophin-1 multi-domain protein [Roseateles sp. SL47]